MQKINRGFFTGERALFNVDGLIINDSIFDDGESPLKESANLELNCCFFRWKYPLWYCKGVKAGGCTLFDGARAGVWYTSDAEFNGCVIEAPKTFRRCKNLTLNSVTLSNAQETLWSCEGVKMQDVTVKGDYFAMNCKDVVARGLILCGNYGFDGAENVIIEDSKLLTKDAFWNCKNVTVKNSFISGEYLGWNSENLTFINCTIESLQGLCYVKNLRLVNCKLINTTLAFEYSSVEADICGKVDSVKNPLSGVISADGYGEIIMESDKVDPTATKIITKS